HIAPPVSPLPSPVASLLHAPATPEISTLSLHDALPISANAPMLSSSSSTPASSVTGRSLRPAPHTLGPAPGARSTAAGGAAAPPRRGAARARRAVPGTGAGRSGEGALH